MAKVRISGLLRLRVASALIVFPLFIAVSGCDKQISRGVAVDQKLRKFIAPDATVLVGIDVDSLKTAPFYDRHRELLGIPLLTGISERSGFDLRRDLSSAVVTWNGKGLAVAGHGRIAKDSIEHSLTGDPVVYEKYKLYRFQDQAISVLNSDIVLGGNLQAVETAIDVFQKNSGGIPDELKASLGLIPKSSQIWLVSRGGLPFADVPMRSEYSSMLANFAGYVRSTSIGIAAESGLSLRARIDCVSEEGSKRVSDAIRGGIGLARLTTKDDHLADVQLYDSIIVQKEGKTVNINADVSPEMADRLVSRFSGSAPR